MKRIVLLYGVSLAALIATLKFLEYRFIVRDLRLEFYLAAVATLFVCLGVWVGYKLTQRVIVQVPKDFSPPAGTMDRLGISKREQEVLQLMARGCSNKEIADQLFISVNTVKTHLSSLFLKLEAARRTQAIQKAKEVGLLP